MNGVAHPHARVPLNRQQAAISGEITPPPQPPRRRKLTPRRSIRADRIIGEVSEKRRHRRHRVARHVRFRCERHLVSSTDTVCDLSASGMFIHTTRPIPPGTLIRGALRYDVDGDATPIIFSAEVRWSTQYDDCFVGHGPGVGVHFISVTGRDRDRIGRMLARGD